MSEMSAYDSFMKKFSDTFGINKMKYTPYTASNMMGAHPDTYSGVAEGMGEKPLWEGGGIGAEPAMATAGLLAGRGKKSGQQILDSLGSVKPEGVASKVGRFARIAKPLGKYGSIAAALAGVGFTGKAIYDMFKTPTGTPASAADTTPPSWEPGAVPDVPTRPTVAGSSPIGMKDMETAWKDRASWLMQKLGLESPGEKALGKTHVEYIRGSDRTFSPYGQESVATKHGSAFATKLFDDIFNKSGETIGHPISALGNYLQGAGMKANYDASAATENMARPYFEAQLKAGGGGLATPGMTNTTVDPIVRTATPEEIREAARLKMPLDEYLWQKRGKERQKKGK